METLWEIIAWTIDSPWEAIGALAAAYVALFTAANQRKFAKTAKVFMVPFGAFDAIVNITAMSIIMADLPKEWLVTHRLQRYKKLEAFRELSYRQKYQLFVARTACKLMNAIDPEHC